MYARTFSFQYEALDWERNREGKQPFPASTAEKAPVARRQAKERWIEKAYSINFGESEGEKERVTHRKREGESDCGQNHTAIFKLS